MRALWSILPLDQLPSVAPTSFSVFSPDSYCSALSLTPGLPTDNLLHFHFFTSTINKTTFKYVLYNRISI